MLAAIDKLDISAISAEKSEILRHEFSATPEEMEALNAQHSSGKKMADLDSFLYQVRICD